MGDPVHDSTGPHRIDLSAHHDVRMSIRREANVNPAPEDPTYSRLAAHHAVLVLAAMVGTLIRLGLDALAGYDGMVIYPIAWSQGIGCGIMGLALAWKNDITGIYPPLYTFLTIGLAGSITTFSTWMLEGYLSFSNFYKYDRNGLHDTVDGLAYLFSTFAIALACIRLGKHLASIYPNLLYKLRPARSFPSTGTGKTEPRTAPRTPLLDFVMIITAIVSYLIALLLYFLAPINWRHRATFPILLAPPGTILRYLLSRLNTLPHLKDRFPLGTFLTNMIATLIISGVFAAQYRPSAGIDGVRCNALWAIQQGFCGCLSTVSTFAVEVRSIKGWRWKWGYVLGSVVLGHLFVLGIVGGVGWGQGYVGQCGGQKG